MPPRRGKATGSLVRRAISSLDNKQLYEECEVCAGSGAVPDSTRMCIDPPSAAREVLRPLPNGSFVCPSCGGRKFVQTGLTAGQVVRMVATIERFKSEKAGASASSIASATAPVTGDRAGGSASLSG